jgi:hypothetical protein
MLLGNGLEKRYRGNEYICNNRRIVGCAIFYVTCVVSKPVGLSVYPPIKHVPTATRNCVECVVLYVVRIVLQESRQLVPRTLI